MKKEIPWILGTGMLVLAMVFWIFDVDNIGPHGVIDINIYDSYFVIPTSYISVLFFVLIFFVVYLIRMLSSNFKSKSINLIFLIVTIAFIVKLTQLISILNAFGEMKEAETYFMPWAKASSNILFVIQILLLILLVFSGIKTGIHYKEAR